VANSRQDLVLAIDKARDQAKELLTILESQRHPQTNRSSSLYLALVSIRKRLLAVDPVVPAARLAPDLEQLVTLCDGKLATIKPVLQDAVRLARSIQEAS
jgi:hypothetical protein